MIKKIFKCKNELELYSKFKTFIDETKTFPYFSSLYDKDMWCDDYNNILNCFLVFKYLIDLLEIYTDRETETLYCCLGDITNIDYEVLDLINEAIEYVKEVEKN